ncbi:hypothetical protein RE6C_01417 [Rhodopirellula europaea 6C]|uniref:Uncharacterized protein n=1 Tax=Rhodopirellula europaea 6C TaxID=1263867 RepID=M2B816_9BACT|nr:hypothetical protein RE6C_01417 [Rhodopirellula europaea 6C]
MEVNQVQIETRKKHAVCHPHTVRENSNMMIRLPRFSQYRGGSFATGGGFFVSDIQIE